MPTVIDSLVVSLSLDASGFSQEQSRAVASLRKFEDQAGRSAKNVTAAVGTNVTQFFRMIESPISAMRQEMERFATTAAAPKRMLGEVGEAGVRTGEDVSRGALAGAASLRVMGLAGLGALGAFTALQKSMGALNGVGQKLFNTGLGAQFAGMPVKEFSAVAQAFNVLGNVPKEETEGLLTKMGVQRAQMYVNPGVFNEEQRQLTMAGVGDVGNLLRAPESPHYQEDILMRLSADLEKMQPAQRTDTLQKLSSIFPPDILAVLAQGPAAVNAEIAKQRKLAPDDADVNADKQLLAAENALKNAVDALNRQFLIDVIPTLISFTNVLGETLSFGQKLAAFLDWLAGIETPQDKKTLQGTPFGGPEPGDTRNWWERTMPYALGGKDAPPHADAPIPPAGGGAPGSTAPALTPDPVANAVAQRESGAQNIWNSKHDQNPSYYTASGYWQITDSNWRAYGTQLGVYPQYSHAVDAPLGAQFAVFEAMKAREGLAPWDAAHGGSLPVGTTDAQLGAGQPTATPSSPTPTPPAPPSPAAAPPAPAASPPTPAPAATPAPATAGLPQLDLPSLAIPDAPAPAAAQRALLSDQQLAGMAAQSSGPTTIHNHYSTDASNAAITVNAPLREGGVIADAVHDRLQNLSLSAHANTGLQ